MSLEFDRYLKPCSNGIDPILAHVYAPIVKPLFVANGNRHGSAGDEVCCGNGDVVVGNLSSDKCDKLTPPSADRVAVSECQLQPSPSAAVASIRPASSFSQLAPSDASSHCVWSCGYDGEVSQGVDYNKHDRKTTLLVEWLCWRCRVISTCLLSRHRPVTDVMLPTLLSRRDIVTEEIMWIVHDLNIISTVIVQPFLQYGCNSKTKTDISWTTRSKYRRLGISWWPARCRWSSHRFIFPLDFCASLLPSTSQLASLLFFESVIRNRSRMHTFITPLVVVPFNCFSAIVQYVSFQQQDIATA